MIAVDWTWLERINLFQVAVVILALWVVVKLAVRFWPWLRKVMRLVDSLGRLPDFMDKTADSIEVLRHQVENDHKTNLRDELTTVLETIGPMSEQLDQLTKSDAAQWQEIEDTRDRPPFAPPKE